jgi:hypothetical protein
VLLTLSPCSTRWAAPLETGRIINPCPGTSIPAGAPSTNLTLTATFTIQPLLPTDGSSNRVQTVIATLQPPPVPQGNPPTYLIGRPSQAEALIVDRAALRSGRLEDGSFHVALPAAGDSPYRIEVSNDLLNWEPMGTNTSQQGTIQYTDPEANTWPWRFYRLVPGTP